MRKIIKKESGLLYLRIASDIEKQIISGVLGIGDRVPSIRSICREYGVSQSTSLQAYYHLESRSMIGSRPKSGYYVIYSPKKYPAIPKTSDPANVRLTGDASELVSRVYDRIGHSSHTMLSLGVPSDELLPVAKLNKGMLQAVRELESSGTAYEKVQGNEKLRRQIARRALVMQPGLSYDDIVTTSGCMNALSYALMAVTERGDTIAVESPVYFGILQLAQSLGLQIIELPTHAQTGVEPDALKNTFAKRKISACILISNFSNPLGSCMPDEHKREVVRLAEKYNVPVIEDDIYGDVYFGAQRPASCKSFDESGIVLWCGSVSKTIAPGYRVGWVAPGRYREKVLRLKLYHSISSTTITQEVIANFLATGRYENHLRKLRHTLYGNFLQYLRGISEYFPEDTKLSRPQGGFVLWVELNKKVNAVELYEEAMRRQISIAPGRMFPLRNQFNNCIRLSYGLLWNEKLDKTLKTLGRLAASLI